MFGGVIVNCCFCFVVVFFGFGFGRVQVLQCLSQDVLLFIKRSMCERERERERDVLRPHTHTCTRVGGHVKITILVFFFFFCNNKLVCFFNRTGIFFFFFEGGPIDHSLICKESKYKASLWWSIYHPKYIIN